MKSDFKIVLKCSKCCRSAFIRPNDNLKNIIVDKPTGYNTFPEYNPEFIKYMKISNPWVSRPGSYD